MTVPYTYGFLWLAYCIEDFKWRLHSNLGLRFEELFWERYILTGQITFEALKGIEVFDLEHGVALLLTDKKAKKNQYRRTKMLPRVAWV